MVLLMWLQELQYDYTKQYNRLYFAFSHESVSCLNTLLAGSSMACLRWQDPVSFWTSIHTYHIQGDQMPRKIFRPNARNYFSQPRFTKMMQIAAGFSNVRSTFFFIKKKWLKLQRWILISEYIFPNLLRDYSWRKEFMKHPLSTAQPIVFQENGRPAYFYKLNINNSKNNFIWWNIQKIYVLYR